MSRFVELARLSDLPDGSARLIVRGDLWIGLFRVGRTVHAIDAHCPHAGANLVNGEFQGGASRAQSIFGGSGLPTVNTLTLINRNTT